VLAAWQAQNRIQTPVLKQNEMKQTNPLFEEILSVSRFPSFYLWIFNFYHMYFCINRYD
jgi:hypothetical protein